MRFKTALAAALFAASTASSASLSGDRVEAARVADHLEIIRVVDLIDAAVDAKDWPLARAQFAEQVAIDFTALVGGEPATVPADALIDGWSANLTAEKTSFHLRGNHRLVFDGADAVTVHSQGYAWNRMERGAAAENGSDPLWEVWGVYEHRLTRADGAWRVAAMTFAPTAERGNPFVRNTPGRP